METFDGLFRQCVGNNADVKRRFEALIEKVFMGDTPLYTRNELIEMYPTSYDATDDDALCCELEDSVEKSDFHYYAFYNTIDLIGGPGEYSSSRSAITELVYYYLLEHLPE